jgi:hypothetical protein
MNQRKLIQSMVSRHYLSRRKRVVFKTSLAFLLPLNANMSVIEQT